MSNAPNKRIPKLRFPEFTGKWVEKKLGDLSATFKSGDGIVSEQISLTGKFPVFGGNGLRGFTDSYTHNGRYVLIGRQGALCGNINRVSGKAYVSEHAIAVSSNENSDPDWLAQKLDSMKLNRLSESSAQPGLAVNKLLKLKLIVPLADEQKKIATFLSAVDGRIEGLEKKRDLLKDYKKGLMQKLFNQSLRFMDDNGEPFPDWEEKRLGEIASKVRDKNTASSERDVLTNSAVQGIVDQGDYFDKDIANQDNLEGYYIVEVDDFVYNPRISVTAPVGPLKRNELRKGVMSPLYTVIRFKFGDLDFYSSYFKTTCWHKYMCAVANYGARHDRMNISGSDFFDMPIPYPCLAEQKKIADCLSALDRKIEQVETQVARTREFKQGLLQKMFV